MVVFNDFKPYKKGYRVFHIREAPSIDDVAMMGEVVRRRLMDRNITPLPDLIVIDGGKAHLAAVRRIMNTLNLHIDAIAIANTYIVFTTIIFTALAIFIALIAYTSSQEHTKHRKASEAEFLKDLLKDCQSDEEHRSLIIDAILGNRHTVEKLETKLNEKIRSLVVSNLEQLGYNTSETGRKLNETSEAVRNRFADAKKLKQQSNK